MNPILPVIAIHGGAGTITRAALSAEQEARYHEALDYVLQGGQAILEKGGSALDAVTEAVFCLEECPLFNAGKGAVFTHAGTHELDASIMDGRTLAAGAVACVKSLRNPILAARRVMEDGRHVLLVGEGAEAFARNAGLKTVPPDYYFTEARHAQWQRALSEGRFGLLEGLANELPFRVGLRLQLACQIALQRIYIKDSSFEAPLGAKAFTKQWHPAVQVDLNTGSSRFEMCGCSTNIRKALTKSTAATARRSTRSGIGMGWADTIAASIRRVNAPGSRQGQRAPRAHQRC